MLLLKKQLVEVAREINSGLTPEQALYEWDL